MKKQKNIPAIIYIFMMMILSAMCDNVRGPFIPILKKEFAVNNKGISLMLLACSLGYMSFTFVGGFLCEKMGQKRVFILGFLFMVIPLIGLYFCNNFVVLIIELFILNAGQAFMAIGTNTIIPIIAIGFQAILMNFTHFCYGLGATFTQRFTGIMLYKGMTWRQVYLIIAGISAIMFLGFIFVKVPEPHKVSKNEKIEYKSILKNKLLHYYILALGFYVAAEMNVGNWFVNFMHDTYKFDSNKSSFYIALFFGTFAIGRLFGGFAAEKFGYMKSVLVSGSIGFGLFISGLFMREHGIGIIAISGLFFAITFPTTVLTISKVFEKNVSYITGIVITGASCGAMIINVLIGTLNDAIGAYKTFYIIPISLLLCTVFMYLIFINTKDILVKK